MYNLRKRRDRKNFDFLTDTVYHPLKKPRGTSDVEVHPQETVEFEVHPIYPKKSYWSCNDGWISPMIKTFRKLSHIMILDFMNFDYYNVCLFNTFIHLIIYFMQEIYRFDSYRG